MNRGQGTKPSRSSQKVRQLNAFTVDVEDYFQVAAFRRWVRPENWAGYPIRVERNTDRLLSILDQFQIKATFFVLGWVAEQRPRVVQKIHSQGHEVASHGYGHQFVFEMGREAFREDIRKAKQILEDSVGQEILGYRAPNYSITKDSLWATDILLEEGFRYDSSVFPIRHPHYGLPEADRFPHYFRCPSGETILEFPPSTLRAMGINVPVAGGAYLRHLPLFLIKQGIRSIHRQGQPAIAYIHPWEIDHEQPRIKGIDTITRIRHYGHLERTEKKLTELFRIFRFGTVGELRRLLEDR